MTADYRALCAELIEAVLSDDSHIDCVQIARRARALLAEPVPVLPGDVQIIEPAEHTLLVPVAQPVPVSERLPGPEDCDEQGRCWLGGDQLASGSPTWILGYPAWASRFPDVHYCWLPAHALPTPEAND
jgi:hypothetical protein